MELKNYLGKKIEVLIDRPLGSKHPEHNFVYQVNYGFVPGTKANDGEEIDVYFLGADKPVKWAKGTCIAIIHRTNDDDDKLIISMDGVNFSDEEIEKLTEFQEKWFEHTIIRN